MKTKAPGAILVEVIVASGILAFGLTLVYLAFLDATRISQRNELSSNAINYLAGVMDNDGNNVAVLTSTTCSAPATTSPPPPCKGSMSVSFLVNGKPITAGLVRSISGSAASGWTASYKMTWTGPAGDQSLSADKYVLSTGGL